MRAIVVVIFVAFVSALLSYRSFRNPITNDGALYPVMARVLTGEITHPHYKPHEGGIVPHPPMYQMSLTVITLIFGSDLLYYRLFGVLCGLLTCMLIRANVRLIMKGAPNQEAAWVIAIAA